MSIALQRHQFTVDEYEQMIRSGGFSEAARVELIRGEIADKMNIGTRHSAVVRRLNALFSRECRERAIVGVQDPVVLEDSEPEPDVMLLAWRDDFYGSAKPRAGDVMLVIEVADTSLVVDREVKLCLYAEASIPEYWLVDLQDDRLHVFRSPQADGTYAETQVLDSAATIQPAAFPDIAVPLAEVF